MKNVQYYNSFKFKTLNTDLLFLNGVSTLAELYSNPQNCSKCARFFLLTSLGFITFTVHSIGSTL